MASNRLAAAQQRGQQQLLREQDELVHQHQHPKSHWQQQLGQHDNPVEQQQAKQAAQNAAATPSSSSSSSSLSSASSISSSLRAASLSSSAEGSGLAGEDNPFDEVLGLSSFEQQYQATLQHLHVGHTRNLSQLAQLFDPAAVLAGEGGLATEHTVAFRPCGLTHQQATLDRCNPAAAARCTAIAHQNHQLTWLV
jgi:hypothetical protein